MDTNFLKPTESASSELGKRVKEARLRHEYTLDTASKLCGVSRSTLSKVENGAMSPTFDVLQKIVHGLEIDLVELFGQTPQPQAAGRRTVTRRGEGRPHSAGCYEMELLATELAHKRMFPFRITITAHSLEEFTEWGRHEGEEFLFVLSGKVRLFSELYAPTDLEAGDSIYFDSGTGHAAVSTSKEDAQVLWLLSEQSVVPQEADRKSPASRGRKAD